MDEFKSILIIRRDNIGDLVCTTPLIAALRKRYSRARIGVLANSYNAPVLDGNSDVDDLYAYSKLKHLGADRSAVLALTRRIALLWKLRRKKLDLVLLPSGLQDARAAKLASILSPVYTLASDPPSAEQHEVERTFSSARALGIEGPIPQVRVVPGAAELKQVLEAVGRLGLSKAKFLVGLHISARRPHQRWQAERFAELAVALHERHGATIILFWSPGPDDRPEHPGDDSKAKAILDQVDGRAPVISWPTAQLSVLIGGLAACDAVICSDGGAMHIAAGLGKPIICFFGDSQVDRWRPWGVRHILLQADTHRVSDLSLAQVVEASSLLLRS